MRTREKKISPNHLIFAAAFICLIAAFAVIAVEFRKEATGGNIVSETEENEGQEIVVWAWDNNFNVKAMRLAAEEYEKAHTDIHITVVSKERNEIIEELTNDFSSEAYQGLPDIVLIEDYQIQSLLSRYESEFYVLNDKVDFDQYLDYKVNVSSMGENHYGIPFDSGTTGLFYRVDLIEQAGYTQADMENLTWDEYIEIGKKVKEITGEYMLTLDPSDLGILRMMMQSAGSWYVSGDGTSVDIAENEALKSGIGVYRKLLESGIVCSVSDWNQFVRGFQEGQVATVVSGCWIISSIVENPSQSGLWRVAAIPRMDETTSNVSSIGGSGWYVLNHGGAKEEAADFLAKMFSGNTAFFDTLIQDIRLSPAWKNQDEFESYETGDAFFGGQQVMRFFADEVAGVPDVNYGSYTYEIEEILAEELQYIVKQNRLEESLQKVQTKAEAICNN